jgi:hypothetical protein
MRSEKRPLGLGRYGYFHQLPALFQLLEEEPEHGCVFERLEFREFALDLPKPKRIVIPNQPNPVRPESTVD